MFGWLTRLFRTPPPDRRIFRYKDGTRKRSADPTEIEVRMADALGEDWRTRVRDYAKPAPVGLDGVQQDEFRQRKVAERKEILAAIDAAFEVEPYTDPKDGGRPRGLTAAERFGLLEGYEGFCLDLMVLARPFLRPWPTGSPPDPEPPPPPSGAESSCPDTGSPSGGTDTPRGRSGLDSAA